MGNKSGKIKVGVEGGDAGTILVFGSYKPCSAILERFKRIDQVNLVGIKCGGNIIKLGWKKGN